MKKIIFILLLSTSAWAQNSMGDLGDLTTTNLRQEGQLFTIQLVMGEPLRIFVVGREEAKFDFADLNLTVRRIEPYPGKMLQLSRDGESFVVQDAAATKGAGEIEVKTKLKSKSETFRFKINNRQH